jgi:hypothetical protein
MKPPDNVIPFGRPGAPPEPVIGPQERPRRKPSRRRTAPASPAANVTKRTGFDGKGAMKAAASVAAVTSIRGFRYGLFLLLLWIRPVIKLTLSLIAVPMVFILPMIYFGMPETSPSRQLLLTWGFGVGFGCFVLRWLYDGLLLKLSPEPIFLN